MFQVLLWGKYIPEEVQQTVLFIDLFRKRKGPVLTSWSIVGLGVLVALLGYTLSDHDQRLGRWVAGFGLANVVVGVLNMFRPVIKGR